MLLVAITLVAIIIVPLFLLNGAGTKDKRNRKKMTKASLDKHQLNIGVHEFWGNSYIGIDADNKKLIFLKFEKEHNVEEVIDLTTVKTCKAETVNRQSGSKTEYMSNLLKVNLVFSFAVKEAINLNLYNYESIYNEDFELKRAERWKKAIDEQIPLPVQHRKVA